MLTERYLKRLARKAGIWLELPEEDILKLENKAKNFHSSTFGLACGILKLPFIPVAFWGQTKRWRLYWAEDPKGPIFVAKRTSSAKHQLEPHQIEYFQSPRRRHKKILHVTASIQVAGGEGRKTVEMPNRMIPGPSSVEHACFYPGLYTHHMSEQGYVNLGGREKECELEKLCQMQMSEISKALPWIDREAKSQADRDIAHYNRLTDFRDDFSGLRDILGNPKTNVCFVGADFIDYERELDACPPGTPLPSSPRSRRKRDADKKRSEEANRKTG